MMLLRPARLLACLAVFSLFIVQSVVIRLALRRAKERTRERAVLAVMQRTACLLLAVLGVRVTLGGRHSTPDIACLTVSNHQSYLDVLVIAAHYPARFVAKQEVASWPLVGLMARLCSTIFIDRASIWQGAQCARRAAASLDAGLSILAFPKGTTTDETEVLPFKPLLLSAARTAHAPVLPLTINYVAVNGEPVSAETRDACCWHGEMEFVSHFWRLLAERRVEVTLEAHEMIEPEPRLSAQELARRARAKVVSALAPAPAQPAPRRPPPRRRRSRAASRSPANSCLAPFSFRS